jgi:hypothetical protein
MCKIVEQGQLLLLLLLLLLLFVDVDVDVDVDGQRIGNACNDIAYEQ